jgi:hypothetical protein
MTEIIYPSGLTITIKGDGNMVRHVPERNAVLVTVDDENMVPIPITVGTEVIPSE